MKKLCRYSWVLLLVWAVLACSSAAAAGNLQITVQINEQDVTQAVQIIIMGGSMPQVLPPGSDKTLDLPAGNYEIMAAPGDPTTMAIPAQERVEIRVGETVQLLLTMQLMPAMMPGMGIPGGQPSVPMDDPKPETAADEELLRMLTSDSVEERQTAAAELKHVSRRRQTVPDLLPLLRSSDAEIRRLTMDILVALGNEQADGKIVGRRPIDEYMEEFIPYLQDSDLHLRKGAAQILVHAWYFPEAAVPALADLLQSPDLELRRSAASALGSPGKRPIELGSELSVALGAALQDSDPEVRRLASRALARVEFDRAKLAEIVGGVLADSPAEVQLAALQTLRSYGPDAEAAESALLAALSDPNDEVRAAVLQVFAEFQANDLLTHLDSLAASLSDADRWVRIRAVEALAVLGERALPALPRLTVALADSEPRVAEAAVQIIWRFFAERAESALPELILLIQNPDFSYREAAAGAALALGAIGLPAVAGLQELLDHGDPLVRYRAATALNSVGPDAVAAIPSLQSLVEDETEHDDVRRAAYFALTAITGEEPEL